MKSQRSMYSLRPRTGGLPVRSLTAVVCLAFVVAVVVVSFANAEVVTAPQPPTCLDAAESRNAAARMARDCGRRVEVLADRSETAQSYANPDATTTVEQYAHPQRVRRADGSWSPLDPTLVVNGDGSVAPRASALDIRFSGGGTGPLVVAGRGEHSITLSWPGALPAPRLSGASASYAEVLPGVDLVVTAQDTSFSEVFVVRSRAAALNPALRRLAFRASLKNLRWADGVRAIDASGRVVLAASAPTMWDSSTAGAALDRTGSAGRAASTPDGPAASARTAAMRVTTAAGQLAVAPDAALLTDPGVTFPLYLDPTMGYTGWTMIEQWHPTQSYWSYDKTDCPFPYTGECAKVGYATDPVRYRSMWQFDTAPFRGAWVINANFSIDLLYSYSSAPSITDLREVFSTIGPGTTWQNNNTLWNFWNIASVSNESYNRARRLSEFTSGDFVSRLRDISGTSAASVTWGLMARNESDPYNWKKFDARTARLIVIINRPPYMPTGLTVDGKPCVAGANRPFVKTATPTLRATYADPDPADAVNAWYAYEQWNGSSWVYVNNGHRDGVANGSTVAFTLPALTDNGIYTWRAQGSDAYQAGPVTHMPGNCEWQVDLTPPAAPTITGDVYRETGCPDQGCGSVGQTGQFMFSSSADVAQFKWGFPDPPTTVAIPPTLGGSASVDWTPTTSGLKTLYVAAVDRAGNEARRLYQFFVAPESPAVARWKLNEPVGATGLFDDTGNGNTATLYGGGILGVPGRIAPAGSGGDGISRTALQLDGVDDYAATPALLDTGRSFSAAAWVKLTTKGTANQTVMSQMGTTRPSFWLEYDGSDRWMFRFSSNDGSTPTPSYPSVYSTSRPQVGVWTHLVGVYDSAAKTIKLYVDGRLEGTLGGVIGWNATGLFRIGRGLVAHLTGTISEVQIWNRVISDAEVFNLSDPVQVGLVGILDFEQVGSVMQYDTSGLLHDVTLYNGASVPPTGAGYTGTGLSLDGSNDYATTGGEPVVYTDQSFTISARVNVPSSATGNGTFVAQGGSSGSTFYLRLASTGYWQFGYADAPNITGTGRVVTSVQPAARTAWVHLIGVYDAQTRQIKLYVNSQLQGSQTITAPWHRDGAMEMGRLRTGALIADWGRGSLDEVRIFQGVVVDVIRVSLARAPRTSRSPV